MSDKFRLEVLRDAESKAPPRVGSGAGEVRVPRRWPGGPGRVRGRAARAFHETGAMVSATGVR